MSCFIMWLPVLLVVALILLYRWYRQSQILENLSDKYVFITGCDTGFGNLLAKQLDRRGMRVLAACLTDTGADNLKKETSSRLQTVILDVTDSESVSSAAKWVSNAVGNTVFRQVTRHQHAGWRSQFIHGYSLFEERSTRQALQTLSITAVQTSAGFFHTLRALAVQVRLLLTPCFVHMIVNPVIRIQRLVICVDFVNVSIVNIEILTAYIPNHTASYHSNSLLFHCRRELRDFGVKVSIIEPGGFRTMMTLSFDSHANNLRRLWDNLPTMVKESYGQHYYEQYMRSLETFLQSANPRAHMVSDCMEHAVTAVYPWTRYSPGWDCKLFYLPLSYLPTVLSDYVLCRSAPKPACM
ncbi:17-beta-hydroxysteroid dehydrogenase type 6-like [Pseudophryne corroboree]|uniref:17-beta-hydroxysteroid dehydrogenase type 6-like n=1 Tax=Pseudophryne corroboree TaxID=495146 RepID=UPI0030816230